jgi:hypothetical protein
MSETFQDRLERVRRRIEDACARCGREPSGVTVLPVAKTVGPEEVREAAACGIGVIGESRVQEAAHKIPLCPGHLRWHMVGHLQRNKVRPAVSLFTQIHSVDSWALIEAVEAACETAGARMPVLLEVNAAGERSKFGFAPETVPEVLEASRRLGRVEIAGLMTLPPFAEDPEAARPFFRRLRELRDEWRKRSGHLLEQLSMGMSHDFEVAVQEGATWVRLGTALFGPRKARPRAERPDSPDS